MKDSINKSKRKLTKTTVQEKVVDDLKDISLQSDQEDAEEPQWEKDIKVKREKETSAFIGKKAMRFLLGVMIIGVISFFQGQNNSGNVINPGDMQANAIANEQQKVEEVRLTKKEYLTRMYRDGLIFEDYTETKKRLDLEFESFMEKKLSEKLNMPLFVKADMTYFQDSLKKATTENLGLDYILANNQDGIAEGRFFVYTFNSNSPEDIGNTRLSVRAICEPYKGWENYGGGGTEIERWFNMSDAYLKQKSLADWKNDPNIPYALNPWKNHNDAGMEYELASLKQKYGEDFVYVYFPHSKTMMDKTISPYGSSAFAPARDINLEFETNRSLTTDRIDLTYSDKYLTVLAQRLMTEQVQAIIEEEGLGDQVVTLAIPKVFDDGDIDLNSYNTGAISTREDEEKFLNKGFGGFYDLNIIYMLQKGDEPDFEKLKSIVLKSKSIATSIGANEDYEADRRIRILIRFYSLSENDKATVVELFKNNLSSENYFRERTTLATLEDDYFYEKAETDGFYYLDTFGSKVGNDMFVMGIPESDISTEAFKAKYFNEGE